jgi:aspartyl-tRNA(Asn)/glutamyl-tRNA(Gln) amidotransferase subunit A
MVTTALADLPLVEAASLVARRALSPVELVDACLDRIAALDGHLRALVTVLDTRARTDARRAERQITAGDYLGPLHGIPIAIKDLADVEGVPTRAGSAILATAGPAARDATVVARLRRAGAIVLGKTTTHEFAFSVFTPPTRNPWDLNRVPGGSSGGSAVAVATGMVYAALGSDTGGSIRIPAAACGVVGLKPTYGRVSKAGVIPLAWSLDHVGPLVRRVADAAVFLAAVAGPDPEDPTTSDVPSDDYVADLERGVAGLRIGILDRYFRTRVDPVVAARLETAQDRLVAAGAESTIVSIPALDRVLDVHYLTILAEAATYHRARYADRLTEYGADVQQFLATGASIPAIDYIEAQRARRGVLADMFAAFRQVDLLLTPTLPIEAPAIGQEIITWGDEDEDALTTLIRFTCPFNQTGLPAITVPCGRGACGLPIGIQVIGPPFAEKRILCAAAALERACGGANISPPILAQID